MYIVKGSEQTCCTCGHWMGTRVQEEDGFVYSLRNLEGICSGVKRMADGAEFRRALTFPNASCKSWKRWPELNSCKGPSPQARAGAVPGGASTGENP